MKTNVWNHKTVKKIFMKRYYPSVHKYKKVSIDRFLADRWLAIDRDEFESEIQVSNSFFSGEN